MFFRSKPPTLGPIKWFPTHAGESISPRALTEPGPRPGAARPQITTSKVSEGLAKVLIADAEQQGRAHAIRILSDHRVQFSVAPDAAMVLRLLEQTQYALCIIDAAILTVAGNLTSTIAKTLIRSQHGCLVLVTSNSGSAADRRLAHAIHATDFLRKPIARDTIHLIVERNLGSR